MTIVWIILAALLAVYLFLIAPRLPRRKLEPFGGLYAHRGLWDDALGRPENSLAAFRAAVNRGYGIETDVHMTQDGRLVLFHDDSLLRMCGVDRPLTDLTLRELKSLRLKDTEETIPTLGELLDAVQGFVPLLIEIKTSKQTETVCEKLNTMLSRYPGKYIIESFDPRAVRWYRKNRPDVLRGQLTFGLLRPSSVPRNPVTLFLASQIPNFLGRPDFIAFDHTTCHTLPQLLTRLFRPHFAAWTVRTQQDLDKLRKRCEIWIFEGFIPSP